MSTEAMHAALVRARDQLGGKDATANNRKLATLMECSRQNVHALLKRGAPLAPEHVLKVEAASGVSRHELRPDVFGEA